MDGKIPGVRSDPDILAGPPVFVGTRVPVRALLDYLEHGRPLAEFLDDFPTVDKALALGVLEHIMMAPSNDVGDLHSLLPAVEEALAGLRPGEITRVGG